MPPVRAGWLAWGAILAGAFAQAAVLTTLAFGARAPGRETAALADALLLCACAALPLAYGTLRVMPARGPQRGWPFLYAWLVNAALPLGGIGVTCVAMRVAARLPKAAAVSGIAHVEEPRFATQRVPYIAYGRGARLKAELLNDRASASARMTALLALQAMPAQSRSPMLRGMLADPLDDVRLLAYGMLERDEKSLTQQILAVRPTLARPDLAPDARRAAHKTLAQLYGELIYAQLVQGDVHRNAAMEAERHARAALEGDPRDASLWRLRGRIALDLGELDAADAHFEAALANGFPRERLLPYLAEAAYLRGDFARVRVLLGTIDSAAALPLMQPILEYWRARGHDMS
ncbi:tetratricopeptide repeat protein [Burkholderia alba]|uniref:tetratricopeptide repeat protein n=1 Tax=Burkholderia alba TaxID=2683677 RepID=UPI002B055B3F|nr:sugar ABC transporter permease [Burkholderia alba]